MKWLIVIGALVFFGGILFLFRKNVGAFLRFLVSKLFLINLVLALSVAFLINYCSIKSLDDYTNHGVKVPVPYLIGVNSADLEAQFEGTELNYKIIDSTFSDQYAAGTVIKQDPDPKLNYDSVKPGRTIYLSIVKKGGEYKTLPDLTGSVVTSKNVAQMKLEALGFKVMFEVKPAKDPYVQKMIYNGKEVKGGDKVIKGATIVLVHGSGKDGVPVSLLNVKGMTAAEANSVITNANLIPEIHYEPQAMNLQDSMTFVITSQNPSPSSAPQGIVASGTTITLIAKKPQSDIQSDEPTQ
ncbi:MAG: PASTA domain-containing protein [Flavobacteriales bacterium]|nr:PASTA domain-containing protein [Flavobacteriales bacterium]